MFKTIATLLTTLLLASVAHARDTSDLRALATALIKARQGAFMPGDKAGLKSIKLPRGADLSRALSRDTESVKMSDGSHRVWNNGGHVRQAIRELAKAARDPEGRVSTDGAVHGNKGVVGVVLDSHRINSVHAASRTTLKVWVGKRGSQPVLFLKDTFARHPVAVPLKRGATRSAGGYSKAPQPGSRR